MGAETETKDDNFIRCRDGKDREIFPALIKDKNKLRHFITKFHTDMAILNFLSPDLKKMTEMQEKETSGKDIDASEAFSDEPYNAMMELLVMAFGGKCSEEEIAGFVDMAMIPRIFNVFFGISGYKESKKKKAESSGMNLSLPS